MPNRLHRLVAPAAAALSLIGAAPALADSSHAARHHHLVPGRSHIVPRHHVIGQVGSPNPGVQSIPLTLPAASYKVANDTQLAAALKVAPAGAVIHLASGTYSQLSDGKTRSGYVTLSGAGDATAPVIQGAHLFGAQFLRFTNIKFSHIVYISQYPIPKYAHVASHIQILNSEFDCGTTATGPGTAMFVRAGSQNITIAGDEIHNCTVGFSSVAQDIQSTSISITHSTFENLYGDAIDLGGLSNVTIADNVIRNVVRSGGSDWHDDGIQFLGNDTHVVIADNVIANVLDQLLFIQDAVKSNYTHSSVNSDILVSGNLMYGNAAYAVQSQGAVNARFVNNTIWDNGNGSLLLRSSGYTGISPTDTVVTGNVLQTLSGNAPAVEGHNLIGKVGTSFVPGAGDQIGATPNFASAATGDFRLLSFTTRPVAVKPTLTSTASASPGTTATDTALGAIGPTAPAIAYGAPRWGF